MVWEPLWALPNIDIDEAVDSEFFALAPMSDGRVQKLMRDHPEFRKFLDRFKDTFGNRIHPPVILRRDDVSGRLLKSEAAGSFRDVLVASIVPRARALNLIYDNGRNAVPYSTYFWVFPWSIGGDYKYISTNTPAMMGLHEASAINPQSSPDLSPSTIRRKDFDEPLLQELLLRFRRMYAARRPKRSEVALFRSLNVANQASLIPAGVDATIHDFGRIVALWISAFEILVHPGGAGQANSRMVFDLLDRVPWVSRRIAGRRYLTRPPRAGERRNLACWIYWQMYKCRNSFLHGNPVTDRTLQFPGSQRWMHIFAPVLYRVGLASFLDLSWKTPWPDGSDAKVDAQHMVNKWEFEEPQTHMEQALRLSRVRLEKQREDRKAAIEKSRRRMRAASP